MSEENFLNTNSNINLINRSKIVVSGVVSVDGFDANAISATTVDGDILVIEGEELSVTDVNLESNKLEAVGRISGMFYYEPRRKNGILKGLFGRR